MALHNLGSEPAVGPGARSSDHDGDSRLVDLLVDGTTPLDEKGHADIPLEGYGFRWLRVLRPEDRRLA